MNDLDSGDYELTPITDNAAFLTFDKQEVVYIEVARALELKMNFYKNALQQLENSTLAK